jgi:hypothetical protein
MTRCSWRMPKHSGSAAVATYAVTFTATYSKGRAKAAIQNFLLTVVARERTFSLRSPADTEDLFIAEQDETLRSRRQSSAGNNCLGMP